ncbi:hypothetical protein [Oceanicoccus sp. KOV_DT_Chl]|uniref:hypothetical protein n=1 Tax=Oceanicoccus sp. KOV_DT_Chl TaxID=1904639 RepID=UPI000C79B439|nr:hypothetical protein [Oceanicoccus sp. KOV_DT_Chl]
MITYLYWFLVIAIAMGLLVVFGRNDKWKFGMVGATGALLVGLVAYYFHFEQVFVKHYGGLMSITVPEGQYHITATWKEDNLWVENYDPKTNVCHFNEYSKGNLLQGKVTIKNCRPIGLFGQQAVKMNPVTKPE